MHSFFENCWFWLYLCFVWPRYAGDLATSHSRQIFQNIPFFVAVQPLLHVLLHCMMPPPVTLRKGSCWKRNGLKSQICISHGFDFSAKVPQLSCFWDFPDVTITEQRESQARALVGLVSSGSSLSSHVVWVVWVLEQRPRCIPGPSFLPVQSRSGVAKGQVGSGPGGDAPGSTCGTRSAWQAHLLCPEKMAPP